MMQQNFAIAVKKNPERPNGWDTYLDGIYLISVEAATPVQAAKIAEQYANVVINFMGRVVEQATEARSQNYDTARGGNKPCGIGFGLVPGSSENN